MIQTLCLCFGLLLLCLGSYIGFKLSDAPISYFAPGVVLACLILGLGTLVTGASVTRLRETLLRRDASEE